MTKSPVGGPQFGLRLEILLNIAVVVLATVAWIGLLFLQLGEQAMLRVERAKDTQAVIGFQQMLQSLYAGGPSGRLVPQSRPGDLQVLMQDFALAQELSEGIIFDSDLQWAAYFQAGDQDIVSQTDARQVRATLDRPGDLRVEQTNPDDFFFDTARGHIVIYAPLTIGPEQAGVLKAVFGLSEVRQSITRARGQLVQFLVLEAGILIVFLSFLLYRTVISPVSRLQEQTRKIAAGEFPPPIRLSSRNELSELGESLNEMTASLQEKDRRLVQQLAQMERLNRELTDRQQELVQSEKMAGVGRLSSALAHEIGNPLAAVISYAGLLESRLSDDPESADLVRRSQRELDRIDALIHGLLDYARASREIPMTIAVQDVLRRTADLLKDQNQLGETYLALDLFATEDRIRADPHGLQQIFVNLAINALDAMQRRGRLAFSTRSGKGETVAGLRGWQPPLKPDFLDRQWIQVDIRDSGPGIPAEAMDRLFEPFFTTKDVGKGTGLGLAVVERLVRGYHGHVRAYNHPDGGAVFSMLLPLMGNGRD